MRLVRATGKTRGPLSGSFKAGIVLGIVIVFSILCSFVFGEGVVHLSIAIGSGSMCV